jgi:hypothetical protein
MSNLSHLQGRCTVQGEIYVKNIRTNLCQIRNSIWIQIRIRNQLEKRIEYEKNHSGSDCINPTLYTNGSTQFHIIHTVLQLYNICSPQTHIFDIREEITFWVCGCGCTPKYVPVS